MNRREFIKKTTKLVTCTTFGITRPLRTKIAEATRPQTDIFLMNDLMEAVENSEVERAKQLYRNQLANGVDAWQIHLSLFPVVQRVLNPPYINPHLPKMYAICRELVSYLNKEETAALVNLEIAEYARRPKLERLPKAKLLNQPVSFKDVETAIREKDWEKSTALMATFKSHKGAIELTRQILFLGSGYLGGSLGHSISCTAFILLEMLERPDQDAWPALTVLSDYFCKGQFHTAPVLMKSAELASEQAMVDYLLRATSGFGIVNLHHTITFYSLERVKHLFSMGEYQHLVSAFIAFMDNKKARVLELESHNGKLSADYDQFYETFSSLEPKSSLIYAAEMTDSDQGRHQLSNFLIKGLCDLYNDNYNPHNLTGLGSVLWVIDRYWNHSDILTNAFFQYIDFFFDDIKTSR